VLSGLRHTVDFLFNSLTSISYLQMSSTTKLGHKQAPIVERAIEAARKILVDNSISEDMLALINKGNGIIGLPVATVKVEFIEPTQFLLLPRALIEDSLTGEIRKAMKEDAVSRYIMDHACHPDDVGILKKLRHDDKIHTTKKYKLTLETSTFVCIAAMNLEACGNSALLAITRAVGVSLGLLPSETSRLTPEYLFIDAKPKDASVAYIQNYMDNSLDLDSVTTAAMMLIARHGIEHLIHDHTYKQSDPSFASRFTSVVSGSQLPPSIISEILGHTEIAARTVCHPFGLASTLSFAIYAKDMKYLPANLGLRLPAVHHEHMVFRVVEAGVKSILALPIGSAYAHAFSGLIDSAYRGKLAAEKRPWSYSPLHRYYGISDRAIISEAMKSAAETLLPSVAGFLTAFAAESALGRAKGVEKMKKKGDAGAITWEKAFDAYSTAMDKDGLNAMLANVAIPPGTTGQAQLPRPVQAQIEPPPKEPKPEEEEKK
jgi:hypothetical protein